MTACSSLAFPASPAGRSGRRVPGPSSLHLRWRRL